MAVEVEEKNSITYIKLIQEFALHNIKEVEALWSKVKGKSIIVAFDCTDLTFIDSSAIGTLVKFLNESHKKGIEMIIINVNPMIEKIFTTAKLNRLLNILDAKEFESRYVFNK